MIRVAALQFASLFDVEANLATCLRLIDRAAQKSPQLIVLPEFANHPAFYEDEAEARRLAVTLEGSFLRAISAAAAEHRAHIVINVSLRNEDERLTVTTLLYDDTGKLAARADKHALVGEEARYFTRAEHPQSVVETPFAKLGIYPHRDGASMETPRCLSLAGAQILVHSMSSIARDDVDLHAPARAAENRVFVVVANTIGSFVPEAHRERVAASLQLPIEGLACVGESRIVAPDGRVLARAGSDEEAVVFAEIDLAEADQKLRNDGTHLFALRRPELYRSIASRPRSLQAEDARDEVSLALYVPPEGESVAQTLQTAAETIRALARDGVDLIVLPELFYLPGGRVQHPAAASDLFVEVVRAVAEALEGTPCHVVMSAVEKSHAELFHMGLLVGARGVVARQPQLHVPMRHAWATAGRRVDTFRLPWGRMALAVGEDLCVPELSRVLALSGALLIASPFTVSERWELSLGAPARAAENRVVLAVATRASGEEVSRLFELTEEFGLVNAPNVTAMAADELVLRKSVRLANALNKQLAPDVHLFDKRPWDFVSELTRRGLGVPASLPAQQEDGEVEPSEVETPSAPDLLEVEQPADEDVEKV